MAWIIPPGLGIIKTVTMLKGGDYLKNNHTVVDPKDVFYFHEGTHQRAYQFMGAHLTEEEGKRGVRFTLWSPHAKEIRVIGNFNHWDGYQYKMESVKDSNLWSLFIEGVQEGNLYKYEITTPEGKNIRKADPFGFYTEHRPGTASIVQGLSHHRWQDEKWEREKSRKTLYNKPLSIYEVHLGSWKKNYEGKVLTYREMAEELVNYVDAMGYTHIELLPIMEHPLDESWGYQTTGFYSVTSRYGTPTDLMYLIDACHQKGIGVIVDWVPGHFCKDEQGLAYFDGKALFEYDDFSRANNKGWGTLNFNLGRLEVQSYLISNAMFWLEVFHVDGIRVDAVSNMIYRDFGKDPGEWSVNHLGGRENLEGISFLQKLNETVFRNFPGALMMAEESTAFPKVTHPTDRGGLGFNFKWNMGWMNDTLKYMKKDPVYRKAHHHKMTFTMTYTYTENFILPLSHDEVVHLKKPLLEKMPGDHWQKFANLRAYFGFMFGHPGKKLNFMGSDIAELREWDPKRSLDWGLLQRKEHQSYHKFKKSLLHFYKKEPALWEQDHHPGGFQWIDADDMDHSVYSFIRRSQREELIVICNFTPVVREGYTVKLPKQGEYQEVFNSDRKEYGGSGVTNEGIYQTREITGEDFWEGEILITLPPLAAIFLKRRNPSHRQGG